MVGELQLLIRLPFFVINNLIFKINCHKLGLSLALGFQRSFQSSLDEDWESVPRFLLTFNTSPVPVDPYNRDLSFQKTNSVDPCSLFYDSKQGRNNLFPRYYIKFNLLFHKKVFLNIVVH